MCHVVGLADAYQVILGEDWFGKYSATLSWGNRCCVLAMGSQRIMLVPGPASGHVEAPDKHGLVVHLCL